MAKLDIKSEVWDDLKFKTMAQHKAINKGDTLQYEII